jgi:acyl-CoA reductase-like NAD-dependent aldehyde dehydrogenase
VGVLAISDSSAMLLDKLSMMFGACSMLQGGKSPLVVWKDVNIDEAVEVSHNTATFNTGACSATAKL